jgi:hypothetical protein
LDAQGEKILEERYGTLTPELDRLRDTPVKYGCGRVAKRERPVDTGFFHRFQIVNHTFIRDVTIYSVSVSAGMNIFARSDKIIRQPVFTASRSQKYNGSYQEDCF